MMSEESYRTIVCVKVLNEAEKLERAKEKAAAGRRDGDDSGGSPSSPLSCHARSVRRPNQTIHVTNRSIEPVFHRNPTSFSLGARIDDKQTDLRPASRPTFFFCFREEPTDDGCTATTPIQNQAIGKRKKKRDLITFSSRISPRRHCARARALAARRA
jgi:hypothetical protein